MHRADADFVPAGHALLLRPDDVVAWRGDDITAPPRVLRELLRPAANYSTRHENRASPTF